MAHPHLPAVAHGAQRIHPHNGPDAALVVGSWWRVRNAQDVLAKGVEPVPAHGVVRGAALHSIGNATPFEGFALHGLPVRTLVRGQTVALDGQITGTAGWGRRV